MLTITDIVLPSSADEAEHWSDATPQATAERMATAGVREVVVKNGAGSVYLCSNERCRHFLPHR